MMLWPRLSIVIVLDPNNEKYRNFSRQNSFSSVDKLDKGNVVLSLVFHALQNIVKLPMVLEEET